MSKRANRRNRHRKPAKSLEIKVKPKKIEELMKKKELENGTALLKKFGLDHFELFFGVSLQPVYESEGMSAFKKAVSELTDGMTRAERKGLCKVINAYLEAVGETETCSSQNGKFIWSVSKI